MCGIAGIFSLDTDAVDACLQKLKHSLQHRGPDGSGCWISDNRHFGFSHNRLSVLDLHERAAQPLHYMHYTIVFNGAIYNYPELKQMLLADGYVFYTTTDTEIIPAAYHKWGIDFLHRIDGMFAFAIFDSKQDEVIIARDRFGEKPLYYFAEYGAERKLRQFVFASEIKAFWSAGIPRRLNPTLLLNYLTLGYVQNPIKKSQTFYNNILSLPPGHYLQINGRSATLKKKKWYRPQLNGTLLSDEEAIHSLRHLLSESVARRLRSDVPVATSLSGGLDSAALLAVIHGQHPPAESWSQTCFSAVFPGFAKDESAYSAQLATAFNIKRVKVHPDAGMLWQELEKMLHFQDEPVTSASVFTQYMLYSTAKQHGIKVIVDGQGADEIFAGYKRYTHWYLQELLRLRQWQKFAREKNGLFKNSFLEQWSWKNYVAAFLPEQTAGQLQQKAASQQDQNTYIHHQLSGHKNRSTLYKPVVRNLNDILHYNVFYHGLEELLRFADRNAMAHGVEVRLPFLSHRLVEFAFGLPSGLKIREGFTKWILRKCFEQRLPPEIVWRKDKVGYEPPQETWMKEKNVEEMIIEARKKLVSHNMLNKKIIDAPALSSSAHDGNNLDWRILNVAHFIK